MHLSDRIRLVRSDCRHERCRPTVPPTLHGSFAAKLGAGRPFATKCDCGHACAETGALIRNHSNDPGREFRRWVGKVGGVSARDLQQRSTVALCRLALSCRQKPLCARSSSPGPIRRAAPRRAAPRCAVAGGREKVAGEGKLRARRRWPMPGTGLRPSGSSATSGALDPPAFRAASSGR